MYKCIIITNNNNDVGFVVLVLFNFARCLYLMKGMGVVLMIQSLPFV